MMKVAAHSCVFFIRLILLQTLVFHLTSVHIKIFSMWNFLRYVLRIKFTPAMFVFTGLFFYSGIPQSKQILSLTYWPSDWRFLESFYSSFLLSEPKTFLMLYLP